MCGNCNTQALFFQNNTCKVHHQDRNKAEEMHLEGDFSPAETPVNPHSAQHFLHDYHCCPEGETERRGGVR